jgi:hypothetical protein
MTRLDSWLNRATRHLSKDSAAQVRTEIREHYESAREAAVGGGATEDEADRSALAALGDAKAANRQYRKVLLTSYEARMLRDATRQSAVCFPPWLKWWLRATPVGILLMAVALLFLEGGIDQALVTMLICGGLAASPFLPVYAPARGRIFRRIKWAAMIGMFGLAFWPNAHQWYWALLSCPLIWIEWTRASIRRKLPHLDCVESESAAAVIHQRQEFVARLLLRPENSQHGAGHGAGMLLFHAAHHHAEMAGLADYAHAYRIDGL